MENGIKPVWVFDGKPPTMKGGELARRRKLKEEAKQKAEEAQEAGNMDEALKFNTRTVMVTTKMKEDAIRMVKLMGLPAIEAPCEAEAQCTEFVKKDKAFAIATEDMDCLTFGAKVMLKGFSGKKEPVTEVVLEDVLTELELSMDQFVDLCIMCGCDYVDNIDGIGPITALKLIKEHKTIEKVVEFLKKSNETENKKKKYVIPENYCFEEARELFKKPEVHEAEKFSVYSKFPSSHVEVKEAVQMGETKRSGAQEVLGRGKRVLREKS